MTKPLVSSESAHPQAKRWWAITASYACLVAIVSLIPIPPMAPRAWLSLDKVGHLCEYGLLAWLMARAGCVSGWSERIALLIGLCGAIAYGAMMEGAQALVPYRSAEWIDLLANAIGAGVGTWLGSLRQHWKRSTSRP